MTEQTATGNKHDATYANDKRNGGYLIRIIGPDAKEFAGREVPVRTRDGKVTREKLMRLIWKGVDEGEFNKADAGKPVALYTFESRPQERVEVEF